MPPRDELDLSSFMQRHLVLTARDPEAMARALGATLLPLEMRAAHSGGPFEASFATARLQSMRLCLFETRHKLITTFLEDTEDYVASFALRGEMRSWAAGLGCEQSALGEAGHILQRKRGTLTALDEGTLVLSLWIDETIVRSAVERLVGHSLKQSVRFEPRIDPQSRCGSTLARALMLAAVELGEAPSSFDLPSVSAHFESFVVDTIICGQQHNYAALLTGGHGPAPRSIVRALAFMEAHAADELAVEHIAGAAGCSVRALQLAFRTWRKTTPKRELTRIRLERAHADLVRFGTACTVGEIALRWGFTHLGRFSRQYARTIGQSPSQTQRFGGIGSGTANPRSGPSGERPPDK